MDVDGLEPISDDSKPTELLFLGTFYHESGDECHVDLIQFKGPVQIREIRVIPLGATVTLSNDSFQLGATNPSKLELEFFYNNLAEPENSTFCLIKKFDFDDKSNIRFICDSEKKVVTDGVLVRGLYSTITLGCYGVHVDHVEITSRDEKQEVVDTPIHNENDRKTPLLPADSEKMDKRVDDSRSPVELEAELEDKASSYGHDHMDVDPPQAIPTISTRIQHKGHILDERLELQIHQHEYETPDHVPETGKSPVLPLASPIPEMEDISDGEVPSSDEDKSISRSPCVATTTNGICKSPIETSHEQSSLVSEKVTSRKTSLDTISQRDQLSDAEEPEDDFNEGGFEVEEISDDEITDLCEADLSEWQDYLASKTVRVFDPYGDTFVVTPLQHNSVDLYFLKLRGKKVVTSESALEKLTSAAEKFSGPNFSSVSLESWVEALESMGHGVYDGLIALTDSLKKDGEYTWLAQKGMMFSETKPTSTPLFSAELMDTLFLWANKGTDIELAASQDKLPFKVRHLKAGIRLIQDLAMCGGTVAENLLRFKFEDSNGTMSVQRRLLYLFMEKYVGVSTQLLILRALDSTLNSKLGYRNFVSEEDHKGKTGFQLLIEHCISSPKPPFTVRVTFSLRSILNKLRLMECLETLDDIVGRLIMRSSSFQDEQLVEEAMACFQFIVNIINCIDQALAHPLRMFPVGAVMEMPPDSYGLDPKTSLIRSFETMNFMRICAVLLCWKEVPVELVAMICDLLSSLVEWEVGLLYLCSEGESTWTVLRALLLWEEEGNGTIACYSAHCLEVMKCLDVITDVSKNYEIEDEEDIRALQLMYSFLSTPVGRKSLIDVLSIGDNVEVLLKCIVPTEVDQGYSCMNRMERSIRKGYALEILHNLIKCSESLSFLQNHGSRLQKLITSMREEGDSCEKLLEVSSFLKPTLNAANFSYVGIENLCESIKLKSTSLFASCSPEDNYGFPPELITGIRILASLGVADAINENNRFFLKSEGELKITELKYEMSLVKIHSLDCLSCFVKILQRICDEYSQPAIHSYALLGGRGEALINLVHPLVKLIRSIMTLVIQTRKTDFRDVTAITTLLQTYALMNSVPLTSLYQLKVAEVTGNIIGTLLTYTIPSLKQGEETEEELNKSAWTALIKETLKFTLSGPHSFVPGLTAFSDLLPLPLPIGTKTALSDYQCREGVKLRKLWSAYLHGLSGEIQEVIGTLCGSTHGKLLSVLKRVCLQLADLTPSTCLVVVRGILDVVISSIEKDFEQQAVEENSNPSSSVKAWVETAHGRPLIQCSAQSARLLGFLSTLVLNAAVIKGGFMQAIRAYSKVDEKYADFLSLLCSVIASKPTSSSSIYHVQAQDHIVSLFQSLCDVQNNILLPLYGRIEMSLNPDVLLANSLPHKDSLNLICSALMGYLSTLEDRITTNGHVVEGVIRTFAILSETEYGFYHLRTILEKYPQSLFNLSYVISKSEMENFEVGETLWPCINYFLEFLKSLITPKNESSGYLPPRITTLSPQEFSRCVAWNSVRTKLSNAGIAADDGSEGSTEAGNMEDSAQVNNNSDDTKDFPRAVSLAEEVIKSEALGDEKLQLPDSVHPLVQLKSMLEKYMQNTDDEQTGSLLTASCDVFELVQICESIIKYAEDTTTEESGMDTTLPNEILLPGPDQLPEIYALRSVYVLLDKVSLDAVPSYWLTSVPPSFDLDVEAPEADLIPCDVNQLMQTVISGTDLVEQVEALLKMSLKGTPNEVEKSPAAKNTTGSHANRGVALLGMGPRKLGYNTSMRGNPGRAGFGRTLLPGPGRLGGMFDPFRSRPPNTSRPPSLHVDDFVALETSGHNPGSNIPYGKGDMRMNSSPFPNRARGSARGGSATRPYGGVPGSDRTRQFRTVPPLNNYYQSNRNDGSVPRGRYGNRGRGMTNSDRWMMDGRNSSGYSRQQIDNQGRNYDDKFRSSNVVSGRNPTNVASRLPYGRSVYRDAQSNRVGSNGSSIVPLNPRWRDKPIQRFQR